MNNELKREKLKLAYISISDVWPYQQLAPLMGGDCTIRVLSPWGKPFKPNPEKDFCGIGQQAIKLGDFDFQVYLGKEYMNEVLEWCDIVYVETSDINEMWLNRFKSYGKPVLYGSYFMNFLEYNRYLGKAFVQMGGLDVPEIGDSQTVTIDELKKWVNNVERKKSKAFMPPVVKSNFITFVPRNWTELKSVVPCLEAEAKRNGKKLDIFLEKNIAGDAVCECCFGSYFNGKEFAPAIVFSQEHKKANDNPMPNLLSGESATTNLILHRNTVPLFAAALDKFTDYLSNVGYRGYIDFNAMFMQDGSVQVLEQTARPGYPTEVELFDLIINHSKNTVADVLMWIAGYYEAEELSDPNVLPVDYLQNNIAIQSVTTGLPNTRVSIPGVSVIDNNQRKFNGEANYYKTHVIPGECILDEDGNPNSGNFWDRTAFLTSAVPVIGSEVPVIEGDGLGVYAKRLKSCLNMMVASQHRYLENVSAWGHTYKRDTADYASFEYLTFNPNGTSADKWINACDPIFDYGTGESFTKEQKLKIEQLEDLTFGESDPGKYDLMVVYYDFVNDYPVSIVRIKPAKKFKGLPHAVIEDVCVAMSHRGTGVFSHMMQHVLAEYKRQIEHGRIPPYNVMLRCEPKLVPVYEKVGFTNQSSIKVKTATMTIPHNIINTK